MMKYEENDEELVFYDESMEEPETAEDPDEEDAEFSRMIDNPYIGKSQVYRLMADDTDDPDILRRLAEKAANDRIWRRKTSRKTGVFWLDLLVMLTFSPYRVAAGWKTFSEFRHLGDCRPDEKGNMPDWTECEKLYQRKKNIFWASIMSMTFLRPAIIEVLLLLFCMWRIGPAIAALKGGFSLWRLIVAFVLFEGALNVGKSLLRSLLDVMKATCETVLSKKKDADKARKAQEAAEKKAREEAKKTKEARKKPATEASSASQPIRPSGRGRYRQSGG